MTGGSPAWKTLWHEIHAPDETKWMSSDKDVQHKRLRLTFPGSFREIRLFQQSSSRAQS